MEFPGFFEVVAQSFADIEISRSKRVSGKINQKFPKKCEKYFSLTFYYLRPPEQVSGVCGGPGSAQSNPWVP